MEIVETDPPILQMLLPNEPYGAWLVDDKVDKQGGHPRFCHGLAWVLPRVRAVRLEGEEGAARQLLHIRMERTSHPGHQSLADLSKLRGRRPARGLRKRSKKVVENLPLFPRLRGLEPGEDVRE